MERRDNPQVWLLRFLLLILSRKQKSQKGRGPACLRSCHGEGVIITRESFFIKSSSSFPILKKFGTRNEGYWLRSLRCNFMHDKMKLFELWETKAVLISSAYNRVCLREWTHLFSPKIKLTKILFTNNFLTLLKVWTSWSILSSFRFSFCIKVYFDLYPTDVTGNGPNVPMLYFFCLMWITCCMRVTKALESKNMSHSLCSMIHYSDFFSFFYDRSHMCVR